MSIGAGVAAAATQGVTTNLLINGNQTYGGVPVVKVGDVETLQVQYDNTVVPGSTVTIKLGDNVTLGTLPPGNTAVSSITTDGNGNVMITFANPFPPDVNQGVLSLNFTVDAVDDSKHDQLSWTVDGEANTKDVIILKPGDSTENVTDAQNKAVSGNYNGAVTVDSEGVVHIADSAVGKALNYTLTASTTTAQPAYPIADQLPAGLEYVTGSFAATLTTWDANGLNRTVAPYTFNPAVTGNSFTGTANLPADSVLTVTYQAAIPDATAREALEAQLQAKYDALGPDGGNFTVALANTATIGGVEKKATVNLTGNKAGPSKPNIGQAFGKSSDWATKNITPDTDGALTPPVDITYTFKADLRQWDGSNIYRTFDRNVVITDTLPAQVDWNTADDDFVTATGITLTKAASCPTATVFATDAYIGQYCVGGKTLLVNVGKDNTTNANIQAKALISTVDELPAGTTSVQGAKAYLLHNQATFAYSAAEGATPYTANRDVTLVDRGNGSEGYNDPSVFTKTTTPSQITVAPGASTTVTYTFTVNANQGVNAADVYLVDYVDPNIFDTSDLAAIGSQLTGQYGSTPLIASDFSLTKDGAGNLVVELTTAGKAKATPANGKWTVNLPLPTKPVTGKQTLPVSNKATVFGTDERPLYWSQVASSVSSYGNEAEVRKTVRDSDNEAWTTNLRAELDENGQLVKDTFVYQVEFIPHGAYNNVVVVPVNDVLPAGTEFVGFLTAGNVDTGASPQPGPVDVGGNLEATYNSAAGTMTLRQKTGTLLDASQSIAAYFAVRITDFDADVPIVNKIGSVSATITPTDGYPLAIAKQDSTNQNAVITDPQARFQLTDSDGNVVVDNIFVDNGYLRVAGEGGTPSVVKVSEPGTYTLTELNPPAGYVRSDETLQIVVGATSVPDQQTFFNEPVGPSVSVGDYVWVDSNRDGRQDGGEPGIPGVVLKITGPDGQPVTGVNGMPVGPQTTDADGKYSFDGLPVLTEGQHYTVTIDREASKVPLAPYTPTIAEQGDRTGDSSTWEAQSQGLTTDGERDPTLDFGFVTKTYAIGDKVWVDTDKDGVQDGGEPPLPGVKVTLVDGTGKTIGTTTTDANGRYIFDNLPAGTYRVRFELTPEQAAKYKFTGLNKGAAGSDSDADPGNGFTKVFTLDDSNTALTTEYTDQEVTASQGIDPTWDAGVVLVDPPTTSSPSPTPSSSVSPTSSLSPTSSVTTPVPTTTPPPLAYTGFNVAGTLGTSVIIVLGGLALLLIGRRRGMRGMH